jgi:hypothetical protein
MLRLTVPQQDPLAREETVIGTTYPATLIGAVKIAPAVNDRYGQVWSDAVQWSPAKVRGSYFFLSPPRVTQGLFVLFDSFSTSSRGFARFDVEGDGATSVEGLG